MAAKITPKNLSYDTALPPFLQRLKGEYAGSGDGRHERAIARPKRARNADDDAEDEPTYVDEETNHTLSKEEYAELIKTDGNDGEKLNVEGDKQGKEEKDSEGNDGADIRERSKMAAIGAQRKRKVGKVVGADEDEEKDNDISAAVAKAAALTGTEAKISKATTNSKKPDDGKKGDKLKKKTKKIKLSFNDDEGE